MRSVAKKLKLHIRWNLNIVRVTVTLPLFSQVKVQENMQKFKEQRKWETRDAKGGVGGGNERLLSDSCAEKLQSNQETRISILRRDTTVQSLPLSLSRGAKTFDRFVSVLSVTPVCYMWHESNGMRFDRWIQTCASTCVCVCVHVCYTLAWVHIKYKQEKMKYSAGLAGEKKSYILKQCVHVNYAGKQLVNGVSQSQRICHCPAGFSGSR